MSHSCDKLNEFTISVMANRNKYDKYKKSAESISCEEAAHETFRKEKMYYKERILHMTRDLFDERCENDDINRAHHEYLKSCIDYLKWSDITDMIDEDTRSEVRESELQDKLHEADAVMSSVDENRDLPPPPSSSSSSSSSSSPPQSMIDNNRSLLSIANKMCIRKKTIDDFIVLKPVNNTDIIAKLPKVRDYHNELMKRASASAAAASEVTTNKTEPE
jgi:hypothetical protein